MRPACLRANLVRRDYPLSARLVHRVPGVTRTAGLVRRLDAARDWLPDAFTALPETFTQLTLVARSEQIQREPRPVSQGGPVDGGLMLVSQT